MTQIFKKALNVIALRCDNSFGYSRNPPYLVPKFTNMQPDTALTTCARTKGLAACKGCPRFAGKDKKKKCCKKFKEGKRCKKCPKR